MSQDSQQCPKSSNNRGSVTYNKDRGFKRGSGLLLITGISHYLHFVNGFIFYFARIYMGTMMQVNIEKMTGKRYLMRKPSIKWRRKTDFMVRVCLKPTQLSRFIIPCVLVIRMDWFCYCLILLLKDSTVNIGPLMIMAIDCLQVLAI